MPNQTTEKGYTYFPDGAKVQVKKFGGAYFDIGAIDKGVKIPLSWKETKVHSGNAGWLDMRISEMKVEGAFDLINLNPANIEAMGGGMFTSVATPGTANTTAPNQVIAANWTDNTMYEIIMYASPTDLTKLKLPTKPTLTSVTLDAGGTPETLIEWTAAASGDYAVIANPNAISGWGIMFNSASMSKGSPKTFAITIDFGSNTPTARTTLSIGSTSKILTAFAIKVEHTDSAAKVRGVEIFSCNPKSGGFTFDFGGANEDGTEKMPISFTGEIDTALTDGAQLMTWYVDTGAA